MALVDGKWVWTDDDDAHVQRLLDASYSMAEIAVALGGGLSRNAIIGRSHRRGLKVKNSPGRNMAAVKPVAASPVPIPPPVVASPPVAVSAPAIEPEEPEIEPVPTDGVLLLDLLPWQCRWIAGPTSGLETRYCGAPRVSASSYCAHHAAITGGRGTPSERRATDGYVGSFKKHSALTRIYQ